MTDPHSITYLIYDVQRGDGDAQADLWGHYYQKLVSLAHRKLKGMGRSANEAEDVALNAFHSFFKAAEAGRFPNLADRDELWRLLFKMTARKAIDQARYDGREIRGGGNVRGESGVAGTDEDGNPLGFADVIGDEPTPEFALMMAERCDELINQLAQMDPSLPAIAEDKLAGFSNKEMAERNNCGLRSVERRLAIIRDIWKEHINE